MVLRRTLPLSLFTLAVLAPSALAQDPFAASERWSASPGQAAWIPDQTIFAGDDAFVVSTHRGGDDAIQIYDAVNAGLAAPRGAVPRHGAEFGVPLVAAGTRGDAFFVLRQFVNPTPFRRVPIVAAYDPTSADAGSEPNLLWTHDMDVRINGPVRLVADDRGSIVAGGAWNDSTGQARIDVLDGTSGQRLGRVDLPAASLSALAISGDGQRIAVVCGTTLYVLDGAANIVHSQPIASATAALALSQDGGTLVYGEIGALNVAAEIPGAGYFSTLHRPGGATELPATVDVSDDGTLIAIGWWNYSNGLDARLEIYDTIFQFPLASHDLPALPGAFQNLPIAARITADGRRAAFGLWGNGTDAEVIVLDPTSFGPVFTANLAGSARGLDLDASGTRIVCGHKDVHSQTFGADGAVRLFDTGERNLQLLSTPRIGGSLNAAAIRPGAFGGWFLLGPRSDVPTQYPGAIGSLLLQRNRLAVFARVTDASGRIDLVMPLPNTAALVGRQLHVQAAFRTPQGLELTSNLVSPFVLR